MLLISRYLYILYVNILKNIIEVILYSILAALAWLRDTVRAQRAYTTRMFEKGNLESTSKRSEYKMVIKNMVS
jgi:hypothetical protein